MNIAMILKKEGYKRERHYSWGVRYIQHSTAYDTDDEMLFVVDIFNDDTIEVWHRILQPGGVVNVTDAVYNNAKELASEWGYLTQGENIHDCIKKFIY